jgi:4-alpha-glucanotransferase
MPRFACVTVPLFSLKRSKFDAGVGDIGMLPDFARWALGYGIRAVQLLPMHPLSLGEASPYGALSSFAIDPLYLATEAEWLPPEVARAFAGQVAKLGVHAVWGESIASQASAIDYPAVRARKAPVLRALVAACAEAGLLTSPAYRSFRDAEASWLLPFAEFWGDGVVSFGGSLRPEALAESVTNQDIACMLQFLLQEQWQNMRAALRALDVVLVGDVPFTVARHSVDAAVHKQAFVDGGSLGVPPDAFSAEGQDWGLPVYNMEAAMPFLTARMQRMAALYDSVRLDHVVGYFRQWVWRTTSGEAPSGAATRTGAFDVDHVDPGEAARLQAARGMALLSEMGSAFASQSNSSSSATGAFPKLLAEDLGIIPEFVPRTLRQLGMPGYHVLPWSRENESLSDPRGYAPSSIATWSTHDTAPMLAFWDSLAHEDRARLSFLAEVSADVFSSEDPEKEQALLDLVLDSSSDLAFFLVQELLGQRARINVPGLVACSNWSYRMPAIAELDAAMDHLAKRARFAERVRASGR